MKRNIGTQLTPEQAVDGAIHYYMNTGECVDDIFADVKQVEMPASQYDSNGRPLGSFGSIIGTSSTHTTEEPAEQPAMTDQMSVRRSKTPERMKFTRRQALALFIGATALLAVAGGAINSRFNHDPAITHVDPTPTQPHQKPPITVHYKIPTDIGN